MKNKNYIWLVCCILIIAVAVHISWTHEDHSRNESFALDALPEFSGEPYVVVNDNQPEFSTDDITDCAFEFYSDLDAMNRCGYALSCVGREIMPSEERGSIGQVKPSGWQTVKYDIIDGMYLYNRCHLIGYQLTGENANACNLITGTRFLNVEGMLPFENLVADYVIETGNHVMYRVTPIFRGNELVARGVQIEALSVEDNGDGISFNIYAYNNQPGIAIDYATGDSALSVDGGNTSATTSISAVHYILNINSKKFHIATCSQGQNIKEENKENYTGDRSDLIENGFTPAGCCDP